MPAPIPDTTRNAILADIRAGQKSCRGIARDHNVSDATVRKIAKQAGITNAFAREHTENATRARQADMAAQRARLAARLIDLAELSLDQATQHIRELTPRDAAIVLGIAVDKHIALERHDSDPGTDTARSLLSDLGRALGAAAAALDSEPAPVEDG